jgi:hypothetical protein
MREQAVSGAFVISEFGVADRDLPKRTSHIWKTMCGVTLLAG